MSDLQATAMPMNELFNIVHERPFSLLFANYSYLLGLAGGIAVIWAVQAWAGKRDGAEHWLALPICVGLVMAGFLNVLAEVQQPGRLVYGYIYGWNYAGTSIIKYGIIFLPALLALSWWLMFQAMAPGPLAAAIARLPRPVQPVARVVTLWSDRWRLFDRPALSRLALSVLVFLGLFAMAYSGIFLMNEHGIPLWNSPAQVLLFTATGLGGGIALFLLLVPALHWLATGEWSRPESYHRWLLLAAVVLSAVVWHGWTWWIARFGDIPDQRAAALLFGPYFDVVVWHNVVAGILLPLVLLATPLGRRRWARMVAAAGVLWSGYAIRFLILVGGQALNRSGAGYLGFSPNDEVVWYTAFDFALAAGVIVFLALVLPLGRTAQAREQGG